MAVATILDFQKFQILMVGRLYGAYELPCQISSKSAKWLRRYRNLTVFKMAPVLSHILDF